MVVIVMVFAVHHSMHLLVDMLYAVFGLLAESASHRASDGEAFAVRKLDDDTEKISASRCLAEDIIHRVGPCRRGALHQRPTKAHFFDLFRAYSVLGNVRNPVFWPDELVDFHVPDCIAGHPPRQCKRRTPGFTCCRKR